ncbi:hypothetical protein Lfu02_17640 [Longispora fulva]|uniref:HK97 family phage major capsid protein n=1 Tax=Longispora fulva TaxID=619741 RepID=A0A8J7GL66_9ACTN|nr:phage major capsid protein [Longispora fulva]MBG6140231.1 HK97 family phage major capsid protein [Longispora fulva]GIG57392.1 hypothetical protein Lfu02_17640 [Longispora fulva]
MRELITKLLARRAALGVELDTLTQAPKAEARNLNTVEETRFQEIRTELTALDERLAELDEMVTRSDAAAEVSKRYDTPAPARVTAEPEVYRRDGNLSYFKDLYNAREKGDRDAHDRLIRNNRARTDNGNAAESRALSTVNSAGGEFVPPLWLEEQFVRYARPGRVSANLVRQGVVPPGTDSINIPKVSTGTVVGVQATQNTGIPQTDLTTTSVSSPVVTIAGGQTISLQLLEQSPLNVDEVVLADLAADYGRQVNVQTLYGSGAAGQVTGLLILAGTQAITYTSATPTLAALYSKIAGAIQAIHTSRYLPPDAIVMHPRRWAWCEAQLDSQNRPLIVPAAGGPNNAAGNLDTQVSQGYVGSILGLPVYVDALIPTTVGAGSNQDTIYLMRSEDLWLWEGQVRAEAFQQTYAQNMSVLLRLYNYLSFQAGRYPQSIATINGTGLVAPTF